MKLSTWARQQGLSYKTAWRLWKAGKLPVPAEQLATGTVIIHAAPASIVVEHRDRLMRFGFEYVEAALAAQGRRLVVLDGAEITDDIVRDLHEVIVSMCARLYGKRAAKNRAKKAIEAI